MSGFELAAQLTQALAWPVFALVIGFVFRRPIRELLRHRPPSKVKAGPFEVEWARVLSEAETEVPAPGSKPLSGGVRDELSAEAATAPAVAVLEAHATIERTLRELLVWADVPDQETRRSSTVGLARLAQRRGLIPAESVRAIEGVSVLRNLAAHGSAREITEQQAKEYLALVDAILYTIRKER